MKKIAYLIHRLTLLTSLLGFIIIVIFHNTEPEVINGYPSPMLVGLIAFVPMIVISLIFRLFCDPEKRESLFLYGLMIVLILFAGALL